MYIGICAALIVLAIILHELAHAFVMRSKGIEIEMMGFGIGPSIFFAPVNCRFGKQTTFVLGLLPLGAFVKPTKSGEEKFERLSYADKSQITGAGILANLAFALLLDVLYSAYAASFGRVCLVALVGALGMAILWFGKKIFCQYVFPVAGVVVLAGLTMLIGLHGPKEISGPIGIGAFVAKHVFGLRQAISIGELISLSFGLLNLLPILPLDGGRTLKALLQRAAPSLVPAHKVVSTMAMLALIACVVYSERLSFLALRHK